MTGADRWIRQWTDGMVFGGSGVGGVMALIESTPASMWLGISAVITAVGGCTIKAMHWYTAHKGLHSRVEMMRVRQMELTHELNRLRAHIVREHNEQARPLPVDFYDLPDPSSLGGDE